MEALVDLDQIVGVMIDINSTIYKSIVDKFGQLRYQAKDDPKAFKAILDVIILDDMLEWASGLDDRQELQEALYEKRQQLLLCNPAFKLQYVDSESAYVNPGTPQSNSTWKRVWDAAESREYVHIPDGMVFIPCTDELCSSSVPKGLIKVDEIIIKEII